MNIKGFQLLLGVFLLGISLTAMFYNSTEPTLSAQDFIEGCNDRYGYASWHVEFVPTKQGNIYICVPQNNTNWSAIKR